MSHSKDISLIFTNARLCLLFTTGRAGTDFLQSLFDQHPNVCSTCEKSIDLDELIVEYASSLLPHNPALFAALSVTYLRNSFAPYLPSVEGWELTSSSPYNSSTLSIYLDNLVHLIQVHNLRDNPLSIVKAILVSFSLSLQSPPHSPSLVLFHLHHLRKLCFYSPYLTPTDRLIICSRNPYSLVSSGVTSWHNYWSLNQNSLCLSRLSHYREVCSRYYNFDNYIPAAFHCQTRVVMLEKLKNLCYLNNLCSFLDICSFSSYPKSTVFGFRRPPDLLSRYSSPQQATTSLSLGFASNVVNRGTELELLGLVDSALITVLHHQRLHFYDSLPQSPMLRSLCLSPSIVRSTVALALFLLPSRSERKILYNSFIYLFSSLLFFRLRPLAYSSYTFFENIQVLFLVRIDRLRLLLKRTRNLPQIRCLDSN